MHEYRLQLVVVWSLLFLTACGAAPATEDERGSFDKVFKSIKPIGGEPEDEADREARKANYFGASGVAFSPDGRLSPTNWIGGWPVATADSVKAALAVSTRIPIVPPIRGTL